MLYDRVALVWIHPDEVISCDEKIMHVCKIINGLRGFPPIPQVSWVPSQEARNLFELRNAVFGSLYPCQAFRRTEPAFAPISTQRLAGSKSFHLLQENLSQVTHPAGELAHRI